MGIDYLASLLPWYHSRSNSPTGRRTSRYRSWGPRSPTSSDSSDSGEDTIYQQRQRIRASGINRRKLEMALYEKFGRDCRLHVTPTYFELQARRTLTRAEILDISY